jgi:hypothetical protein
MWTIDRADECTKILRNIGFTSRQPATPELCYVKQESRKNIVFGKKVTSGIHNVYLFISHTVSGNTQNEMSVVFITEHVCFWKLHVTWLWTAKEK